MHMRNCTDRIKLSQNSIHARNNITIPKSNYSGVNFIRIIKQVILLKTYAGHIMIY